MTYVFLPFLFYYVINNNEHLVFIGFLMFRVYLFISFMLNSGVQYVQLLKIRSTRAQYKDYEMLTKEFSHK